MTLDEATAALAANPAALVFAGRDVDAIIASFGGGYDPDTSELVRAFRLSLEGANMATRLALTTDAIQSLGAVAANREKQKADAEAAMASHRADVRRREQEHAAAQARRDRYSRMFHPAFASLRARINAAELQLSDAVTPADFDAIDKILSDAFDAATASISVGSSAILAA